MSETIPPCGAAALDYVNRGLAVIPVAPGGKVPVTKRGVNDWTDNPEQIRAWWGIGEHEGQPYADPTRNVGIVCGQVSGGLVCIDLDQHDNVDGRETLKTWQTEHGYLPETITQITGGGGLQMFYRADREIRPSVNGELGVDIRGDGSFAVVPPSLHPSGEYYEWSVSTDDCDIADADSLVYAFIDYVRPAHKGGGEGGEKGTFEWPEGKISTGRNDTLFRYASSLRSKGLDMDSIRTLVLKENNDRCDPPLTVEELNRTIFKSTSKYEPGNKEVEEAKAKREAEREAEQAEVATVIDSGKVEKADKLKNVTSLEVCQMMRSDQRIANGIKFDVLDQRPWKVAPLPWDKTEEPRPLIDGDIASMYGVMEYGSGIRSMSQFRTAFEQFMMLPAQRINPIDDVIADLPTVNVEWGEDLRPPETCTVDGKEELTFAGNLFKLLLGADDNEYTKEVELLMLRQLVARAFHPGCKADSMVVLAGGQGIGKSTFARELALNDRFFLDGMSKFDEEHKRRLIGKLVVEVSELEAFNHSDMSSIKQAITAQRDNIRMPYKEFAADYPRTCVFIGTTNEGAFLTDTTGNRRFLPIVCNQPSCEPNPLLFDGTGRMMIRQAIAETVALYRRLGDAAFMKTLILPRNIMKDVSKVQDKYAQEDDTLMAVISYLDELSKSTERVNVKMVMIEGMGYTNESYSRENRYVKTNVANALNRCDGWELMESKQRVGKYGIAKAWGRVKKN